MGILSILGCNSKSEKKSFSNNELVESNIGKVYKIQNRKSEPNFGEYLILISTDSKDTYAFNSFDIIDNEPVGKLIVSYSKKLKYKQVDLNPNLIEKAKKACALRMEKESEELNSMFKNKKNQSDTLKEKYGIEKTYALNRFGQIKNSEFKYGIWIDKKNKEFAIQVYSEKKILKKEKLKWVEDPMWQISAQDQKKIIETLDRLLAELENK